MKAAEEILLKRNIAISIDYEGLMFGTTKKEVIEAMEEYTQEHTKDYYPKEFVEWILSSDVIKNDNKTFWIGGNKDYTLDELFTYWKDKIR